MELNFLIEEDLSLEAVLIPLLPSLSLGALILLQLRLFFNRQGINDDVDEVDVEELDNSKDWGVGIKDRGKNE